MASPALTLFLVIIEAFSCPQVSDMVQDSVGSFSAPQLAAMCGAYVQLCRHSYNDSQLFDAIVEQVLRSFKVCGPLATTKTSPVVPRDSLEPAVLLVIPMSCCSSCQV